LTFSIHIGLLLRFLKNDNKAGKEALVIQEKRKTTSLHNDPKDPNNKRGIKYVVTYLVKILYNLYFKYIYKFLCRFIYWAGLGTIYYMTFAFICLICTFLSLPVGYYGHHNFVDELMAHANYIFHTYYVLHMDEIDVTTVGKAIAEAKGEETEFARQMRNLGLLNENLKAREAAMVKSYIGFYHVEKLSESMVLFKNSGKELYEYNYKAIWDHQQPNLSVYSISETIKDRKESEAW
jgi:hypothetical protein